MKIDFLKRKKVFKKENFKIQPQFYWNFIFVFFLILVIASFVVGFMSFKKINKEAALTNLSQNGLEKQERQKIEKALDYFRERENKTNQIISAPNMIIDPSN